MQHISHNKEHITKNRKSILLREKGFTLIELLIVMAMTAMIATISLANYRVGETRKRVGLAGDSVLSSLGLAQSYALSGKSTTNSTATCRIPQYYFITFTLFTDNYTLYALDNCATTDLIQTFTLPTNTRITGLTVDGVAANAHLNVAIYLPFGQLKDERDGAATYTSFSTATITVQSNDNSVSKTVSVDGVAGRIGQ